MTSDSWSFSLRTGNALSDDDDSQDQSLQNSFSNEADFIRQIDLSSRQDNAKYKPNPWSIAKVNAACRRKHSNPPNPTHQTTLEKAKPPEGAIVDAFKRQTKSRPKIAQSDNSRAAQAQINVIRGRSSLLSRSPPTKPIELLYTSSHAALPRNSDPPNVSSCGMVSTLNHAVQENAHIVTDFAHPSCLSTQITYPSLPAPSQNNPPIDIFSVPSLQDFSASPTEPLPTVAPVSHAFKCYESDSHTAHAANDRRRNLASSNFPPRPYAQDEFPGPQADSTISTLLSEHQFLSSYPSSRASGMSSNFTGLANQSQTARASIDRLFSRRSRQIPGRQVLSSPPAPAFYSSYLQNTQTKSSPARLLSTTVPTFLQTGSTGACQMNRFSPKSTADHTALKSYPSCPRKRKAPPKLSSHFSTSPSPSPPDRTRAMPKPSPARRQEKHDQLPASPDSQWSTICKKKRLSTKVEPGVKTSGKFRLPLSLGSRTKNSTIAGNKARVITYLPPPKKKNDMMNNTPTVADRKIAVDSDFAKSAGDNARKCSDEMSASPTHCSVYYSLDDRKPPAISDLISPPPSDDPPTISASTPAVVFDVDGVIRRYKMVRQGLRMRKQTSRQLWDVLGLQSCGVVYKDPNPDAPQSPNAREIAIVSWP